MQKLRIAIVVGTFPTISETFIVNQINALIAAGHDVQVFAFKKGEAHQVHASVKTHDLLSNVIYNQKKKRIHLKNYVVFFRWLFSNLFMIRWGELIKSLDVFRHGKKALKLEVYFAAQWFLVGEKYDIIHSHFGPNAQRIAMVKSMGFMKNTKLITTFHGYDLIPNNAEAYNQQYKSLLKETTSFTINSVYLKCLLSRLNIRNKSTHILPVGLSTEYFKKSQNKDKPNVFKILFCGRLVKLKGPDLAIDIFNDLLSRGHNHVILTIVGEGQLKEALLDQIKTSKLEKKVFIKGALTQERVREEMDDSDILIMPGIHDPKTKRAETQGLVIQEAQAMELPVIVSDVGGMKYGMIPNETGFVVKEGDVNGFADAIEKLINNEELRSKMGKRGREYVVTHFDNDVLREKLLAIYYSALKP